MHAPLLLVWQYALPVTITNMYPAGAGGAGCGGGSVGGCGGGGGMANGVVLAQIVHPSNTTEPSACQLRVAPVAICTFTGPLVPE